MNKTVFEKLLAESKLLEQKAKEARLALKKQKVSIQQEFTAGMNAETIAQQIKEAQAILDNSKIEYLKELSLFKDKTQAIREKRKYAKELLDFAGYKISNGLPRLKVQRSIDDNGVVTVFENDITVTLETNNENWRKEWNGVLTKAFESKGLSNGEARNIAYKTKLYIENEFALRNAKTQEVK
jgi:hypothetical protein